MTQKQPAVNFSQLCSDIARWYSDEIEDLATGILEELKDKPADERMDYIRECVDGCAMVIYTMQARLAVVRSSQDLKSLAEDMGLDNPTDEQRAFLVIQQDVLDYLNSNHEGWDNEPEDKDEDEEDEDEDEDGGSEPEENARGEKIGPDGKCHCSTCEEDRRDATPILGPFNLWPR